MATNKNESSRERDLWNALPTLQGIERGQTYFDLSLMAFEQGEHTRSLALAETACTCFLEHSDEIGYANCLTTVAFNLYALDRKQEAISALFKAVMRFARTSDSQEWEYRGYLASWLKDEEQFDLALTQLQKSLEHFEYEGSHYIVASIEDQIAGLLCEMDRCAEAIEHLKKARILYKSDKQPELVGVSDIEIARCYNHLDDGINAQAYALKAIGVFDSIGNSPRRAQAYTQWGRALNRLSEYEEALRVLEIAHNLVTSLRPINFYGVYAVQKAKVRAFRGLGREDDAKILERQNEAINETLDWE